MLGDSAPVTAMLDRLLHHGHLLKCGPRSWRTKTASDSRFRPQKGAFLRYVRFETRVT